MGLLTDERRVEDADDAHPLAGIPRETRCRSPGPTQYTTPGARGHSLPGVAILENAAAGTHVVCFPVMLVPEVRALAGARSRLRDTEPDAVGPGEQAYRR